MTTLEHELQQLKEEVIGMWKLVELQLEKAKTAMLQFDTDLAREVILMEKRVNALELKIDRDCENIFALFCPVAVDLRFVLAILKINNNLERIGDIAEGIARYMTAAREAFSEKLIAETGIERMYVEAILMLADTRVAFEKEDTALARSIFKRDDMLDLINTEAHPVISRYIASHNGETESALHALSIIRRLERVGDQVKNMAEEIIFFVEAKILKHGGTREQEH